MADTTVFVDNAVKGNLPGDICACTGRPADGWLALKAGVGSPSPFSSAWSIPLAVLGAVLLPFSLILIVPALVWRLTSGRENTPVQVPWAEDHYTRLTGLEQLRRRGRILLFGGLLAPGIAVPFANNLMPSFAGFTWMLAVLAALSIAAGLGFLAFSGFRIWQEEATAHLDASRRWVTFRNVHPDFAAAVEASDATRSPSLDA